MYHNQLMLSIVTELRLTRAKTTVTDFGRKEGYKAREPALHWVGLNQTTRRMLAQEVMAKNHPTPGQQKVTGAGASAHQPTERGPVTHPWHGTEQQKTVLPSAPSPHCPGGDTEGREGFLSIPPQDSEGRAPPGILLGYLGRPLLSVLCKVSPEHQSILTHWTRLLGTQKAWAPRRNCQSHQQTAGAPEPRLPNAITLQPQELLRAQPGPSEQAEISRHHAPFSKQPLL